MSEFSARQYADFLREYDALLQDILQDQRRMLSAVTNGKLEGIRQSMNGSQANTMRLEQLEARRTALQTAGGFEGLGIRQVVAGLTNAEKAELLPICNSIDATAREIHFVGEKSMGMARCNMAELDPALLEGTFAQQEEGARENPYERLRRQAAQQPAMETKA